MGEAILLALWVGTALFFTVRETKAKKDRESHEWWISDLRDCIHSVEGHFCRQCEKIITDAFSGRNVKGEIIIDEYQEAITELKDEYSSNLYEKVVDLKGKHEIKSIPEYLENEYKRNIFNIADTYRYFGDIMTKQTNETRRR